MSAPGLPFLWPILFRPLKISRTTTRIISRKSPLPRNFTSIAQHAEAAGPQRYGTAHEPVSHLRDQPAQKELDEPTKRAPKKRLPEPLEEEEEEEIPASSQPKTLDASESTPSSPAPEPPKTGDAKPLDTVLHMPSPAEEEQQKPPHLKTPPYVHHFDTYGLVKDLSKSGFTEEQAVTVMKAVRGILADNMALAHEGLISKSNVENETYLFRAACSELRTELGNSRKGETEKLRTERNQLQHEVDILNQRLMQETGFLKDELKGLFDDRKMAVRQEQRTMETKIQELNYKITVVLNSDARSEVESLRWILTRRAAMTVGISAFMLFVALRYSSYVSHHQSEEKKKAKERKLVSHEGQNGSSSGNSSTMGKEDNLGGELLATEGGVSLG